MARESWDAYHAYPEMLDLVASGNLKPQDLITRTISLDEVPAALDQLTAGTAVASPSSAPSGQAPLGRSGRLPQSPA